jgi:hypothetical protein
VAGHQPERAQPASDPVGLGVELGPGDPPTTGGLGQRDPVGSVTRRLGQKLGEVRGAGVIAHLGAVVRVAVGGTHGIEVSHNPGEDRRAR